MQSHSTLARLQQLTTVSLVGASGAWLIWFWDASIPFAVLGAAVIMFGYTIMLALQFGLSRAVAPKPDCEAPTLREISGAWLREVLHAARVFAWRQPFRWREESDYLDPSTRGKRGVVFIHGFLCNRGFWNPWMKRLRSRGHAFVAVNLEPVFGSIDLYAPMVQEAVQRVSTVTGMAPLLVCHSMGGVVARALLKRLPQDVRVHRVITIASPHHGTWLARFSAAINARQVNIGSEWLLRLRDHEATAPPVPFTCWYTNCDNIVFPVTAAKLEGADNRLVRGAGHVDLAFRPEVMQATLAIVSE